MAFELDHIQLVRSHRVALANRQGRIHQQKGSVAAASGQPCRGSWEWAEGRKVSASFEALAEELKVSSRHHQHR